MSEVRVFVGPKAIEGANKSAHNNPIARAIRFRLSKPWSIPIHTWDGACRIGGKFYRLPLQATKGDSEFTLTGNVAPFAFQLSNEEIPPQAYVAKKK